MHDNITLDLPLTDLRLLADVATALHDVVLDAGFVELLASIEFYLVQPIGAVRCLLDERSKVRLYPGRRRLCARLLVGWNALSRPSASKHFWI